MQVEIEKGDNFVYKEDNESTLHPSEHLVYQESSVGSPHQMPQAPPKIPPPITQDTTKVRVQPRQRRPRPQILDSDLVYESEEWSEHEPPQSSIRKLYKQEQEYEQGGLMKLQSVVSVQMPRDQEQKEPYYMEEEEDEDYDERPVRRQQVRSDTLLQLVNFVILPMKMTRCWVTSVDNGVFSLEGGFDLYLREEKRLIMRARKKHYRINSRFTLFSAGDQGAKIASAMSNLTRTEYKMTTSRKVQAGKVLKSEIIIPMGLQEDDEIDLHDQKCFLKYQTNFWGLSQQRMQVAKPKKHVARTDRFSDIKTTIENCQFERLHRLWNKAAEKDNQGFNFLDFKDKNVQASPHNVIIEDEMGEACLTLAKRDEGIYALDIMHPFNLLEGFFVAICNLDRKPLVH